MLPQAKSCFSQDVIILKSQNLINFEPMKLIKVTYFKNFSSLSFQQMFSLQFNCFPDLPTIGSYTG